MTSTPIIRTEHGAFCAACQSLLSIEEEDFGVCDACDGEGIGGDDDCEYGDDPECVTPQDTTPPELKAVLGEALAKAKGEKP